MHLDGLEQLPARITRGIADARGDRADDHAAADAWRARSVRLAASGPTKCSRPPALLTFRRAAPSLVLGLQGVDRWSGIRGGARRRSALGGTANLRRP